MNLPRITSLDLRPLREDIEWDWPVPPPVSATWRFSVTIVASTAKLDAELARVRHITERANTRLHRPMRRWYWHRICLVLGTVLLEVQVVWLLAYTWL